MRSELNYAGKNLSEFGMWFDNSKVYKKPSKRFMGYDIPARNGTLYQSENKFDNVIIEFDCFIKDNFDQNYNDLVNYLNSFETYQKLVNSYNGNMYRMALFHEAIEVDTGQFLKDGRFKLFFDCKPQEFYTDGAEFERIVSHYDTYTGDPAVLINEGESTVTNLKVALEPIQTGTGDPSPTNVRPIYPANGKNMFDPSTLLSGYYADKDADTLSGSTTNYRTAELALYQGTYTISFSNTVNIVRYREKGITSSSNVASGVKSYTFTVSNNATVALGFRIPDVAWDDSTTIQIERGSVATSYVSYQSIVVQRTGINQFDEIWESGSIASADGQNTNSTTIIRAKNYIPVYPNTQYYLSNAYGSNIYWFFYGADKTYLNSYGNGNNITVTTPSNAYYMRIRWASGYGTTYRNDTVVNYPSSVTTYEPYAGHTYTTDLQTTVYGGTVDLATGVLTVDRASVNGGSLTWTQHVQSGVTMYYADISDGKPNNTAGSEAYIIASSAYIRMRDTVVTATTFASADDASFAQNKNASCRILVKDSRFSTESDLTNWMAQNNVQFLYKLATPQTINLTPQQISLLTGMNYISSSGEVTVITLTPLILKNPSPMTAKPIFKFTNITAPFTVSANGETIISFQNAIRLIKYVVANNMTFNANGTTLTVTKTGTPAYTETSILINSGYLPAGRYSFSSATLGTLAVKSADGTETYSSGGTFTLTEITQVKVWYTITPSASTPQTINMPIFLRPLGDLYVNSELMDCYMLDGDTAYSFNECVNLPKDFLQLDERTVMTMTSGAVGFIAPNWWRL